MSFYRFFLAGLIVFTALPAFAAEGKPECPKTIKADDLVVSAPVKADIPLLPLSRIVPNSEVYCSETMDGGTRVRRWHERIQVQGKPVRLDHYSDGIGMGWGPKSTADYPVIDRTTKTQNFSSFDCRSSKRIAAGAPSLNCTVYPSLAEGKVKPLQLTLTSDVNGKSETTFSLNPRAFHHGDYVVPDRAKPLTFNYGVTEKPLYFVGGVDGMMSATLGGKNELDTGSSATLLHGLMTGPSATLSYTDYEGGAPYYTFSVADIEHARITMGMLQTLVDPIGVQVVRNFQAEQATP